MRFFDKTQYKSVLVLDGDIPSSAFFKAIKLPIISADGATNKLHKIGISPSVIIGDLDSVNPKLLKQYRYEKVIDQSLSDFQKSLKYLETHDLLPTIICGIAGGYIDHTINNISIFMQTEKNLFVTDAIIGYKVQDIATYDFPIGTKISIIGMPECVITSKGLKWELQKYVTKFPGQNSCFNRVISTPITLIPHSGAALLLVYTKKISDAGLLL